MKILIAYTTKYGAAEICARELSKELNGQCDIVNLKDKKDIDITQYDKVILGGSIYAGNSQQELREFSLKYCDELCKKPLGLYLSCMGFDSEMVMAYFAGTFPGELLDHATAIRVLGGIFNFKKMNFLERTIIKMKIRSEANLSGDKNPLKEKKNISTISRERVTKFADDMNKTFNVNIERFK